MARSLNIKNKIKHYEALILGYLREKAKIKYANLPDCETLVLADTQQRHYQTLTMGWDGTKYVHSTSIHLSISENGKIWIHLNSTDIDIAELFVNQGVPKSDIVLAFHKEYMREMSEYAVR